jgi:hypothetical protein
MRTALFYAIWLSASIGCGGVEPLPYDLPPPDQSLDPAHLVTPAIAYGCGNWKPGLKPVTEEFLADVAFTYAYALSPPAKTLQWIHEVGGTPLYSFHFSAVRVWMPTASVEQLYELAVNDGSTMSLHVVTSPARYDWEVLVKFKDSHPVSPALRSLISTLGGRIEEEYLAINVLLVTIPDRSLISLRADSRVEYAEANLRFCVGPLAIAKL